MYDKSLYAHYLVPQTTSKALQEKYILVIFSGLAAEVKEEGVTDV